jgi:hypothetical protein
MTIASWRAEFYPTPAKSLKAAPVEQVLDHCIQKWVGLRQTNLAKHGLRASCQGGTVVGSWNRGREHTVANASQCALCAKFYSNGCNKCPLNKGGEHSADGCYKQWSAFAFDGNPEKMIRSLRDAKKKLLAPPPITPVEQALVAMQQARNVLNEISTTGGKYGYHVGDIVIDATMVEYNLQKAMEQLEKAN